ncbi:hypothetical protein CAPTEDRAFT_168917 [Capitella teleta]|uniref:Arf-GAP domain-containing protein n=1 Tax=Capitella teleta TaxID=283909 RepID=R7U1N2_CAPTE|nr:hypothetical protein CAPTEDRAFT_168917 [Capitella teleta]|eukprot:ELU00134.1 hypothetical protein CAPTEDRAFT_168917 [Capitella teleta]
MSFFADPGWASVNRGVLICDECCSVHRSLGRHISQIRSLKKGSWNSNQLAMVHQLVSMGANNIWEHSLLDPSQGKQGRRKPNPRDSVHPMKADFIRAKYQFLAFVNKQRDSEIHCTAEDLNKQLHSSVRTSNLETSLRLLSLGADPNYFHPEKGSCALHVAASAGQCSQVELLVVYGADPGALDANGKTPIELAKEEKHADLPDRLVECQYELTDRLAAFLCHRKPDHRGNQHFIIPEMADSSLDLSELAKAAKKKLQALSNHLFEELAMDVYDEVDRRENESLWLDTQRHSSLVGERQTVPFLPVNPEFSSTRNQGRQKLARFNAREFATLIIDILSDARRRQYGVQKSSTIHVTSSTERSLRERSLREGHLHGNTNSSLSDDEPLYDSVASDEDYASIGDNQSLKEDDLKDLDSIQPDDYNKVKQSLVESQMHIQRLVQSNFELKQEINMLRNMVQKLIKENQNLKGEEEDEATLPNGHDPSSEPSRQRSNRPMSMFELNDPTRHKHWSKQHKETGSKGSSSSSVRSLTIMECDTPGNESQESDKSSRSSGSSQTPVEGMSDGASGEDLALPTQEDVVKKTERITKKIQELLVLAQDDKLDSYIPCSEKIHTAVVDMSTLFPSNLQDDRIQKALLQLSTGAERLGNQCKVTPSVDLSSPEKRRTHTQQVIQCAYDIAKAAKQLVIMFE